MPVINVKNTEQFDDLIENSRDQIVVAQFITNWSGACREFADKYEEISEKYHNVSFLTVNIDKDNNEIAENLNISSAPTFLFFESGKLAPLKIIITKPSQKHLIQAIDRALNGGGRAETRRVKKDHHGQHAPPRPRDRRPPSPRGRYNTGPDRRRRDRPNYGQDDEYRYHKPSRRHPRRDYEDDYS